MKRVMAHTIIYAGVQYPLSIATIDGNKVIKIESYEQEIHSTIFISGKIQLVPTDSDVEIIRL